MAGLDPSPPGRPKAKYNGSAPAPEDRPVVAPERFAVGRNRGVCLIDRAGRPLARSIWVFLDHRGFCPGRPENKAWISLDFLGFSRPNRDVSMSYAGFSAKKISRALLPLGRRRRDRSRYSYDAEMQYGSSSKPNSFSAFLQSIADDRNCRFFVEPPTGALSRIIGDYQRHFTRSQLDGNR
jgi:hypothetical protein